jgi:hypothetical protein
MDEGLALLGQERGVDQIRFMAERVKMCRAGEL